MIEASKRRLFDELYAEFVGAYLETEVGRNHLAQYGPSRSQGVANLEAILEKRAQGEDITDDVLLRLLPHIDSAAHRDAGAWVHVAPAINGEVRSWYESAGRTRPEDWPKVAEAILAFVLRCRDHPDELALACEEFAALRYSKGFQSGMLSPVLNAVNPDAFRLMNEKPRRCINHLTGSKHGLPLVAYPATNAAAIALVEELSGPLGRSGPPSARPDDLFDMFSHWLVAVKRYDFPGETVRHWKIAPGENAWNWDACRDGGFIAMGWDDFGDVSEMDREQFDARFQQLEKEKQGERGWSLAGVNQLWRFAKEIAEGDRIVANRGRSEVLGIGTVTGPCFYVEGVRHRHRLPVRWDDLTPRQVDEGGWTRTLVELDRDKFDELTNATRLEETLAEPFASIFASWDEAWWAFDLMAQALEGLGITDLDDPRYAVTTPKGGSILRLIAGDRVTVGFWGGHTGTEIELALLEAEGQPFAPLAHVEPFSTWTDSPDIGVYRFPLEGIKDELPEILELFERSLQPMSAYMEHWTVSRLRAKHHRPEIAAGIVDPDARRRILSGGVDLGDREENGFFSEETFDLLSQLHESPTKAFYQANKDAFAEQLEEPFKRLFADVVARLPDVITERMETEKNVFSRIPKNDYGKGGAWPYFWGALYPQGSKRIADSQLFIGIHRDRLEFGFYIGEIGDDPRLRFRRNLPRYRGLIAQALDETLAAEPLGYGEREATASSFAEWAASSALEPRAAIRLTPKEAIEYTCEELAERIAAVFVGLYPLVLLTLEEDPTRSIHAYLGWDEEEERPIQPPYSLEACAEATGFPMGDLRSWVAAIHRKRQAILYGPPGTGKTFLAKELARHLVGNGDGFVDLVQFHPAYSYEDFIQGIRPQQAPDGNGLDYPVLSGRFLRFCREAAQRRGICALIIDEINRANLARVFGELMYLLEYRDDRVKLAVSGDEFAIPANVRLLGTMNTADRSIALVDHALRRRFAFVGLFPRYEVLTSWHAKEGTGFDPTGLIAVLKRLNHAIDDPNYAVGISFFLVSQPQRDLPSIWQMEIEPYLEEYFFDQRDTVEQFRWDKIAGEVLGS